MIRILVVRPRPDARRRTPDDVDHDPRRLTTADYG
jgi:hypothetical protein